MDFLQALTTFPRSSGGDSSLEPAALRDRSWALRASFARNLTDHDCFDAQTLASLEQQESAQPDSLYAHPSQFTLRSTLPTSDARYPFPAITMNTTVVENGERFRLSNYGLPHSTEESAPIFVQSSSFLEVYGRLMRHDGKDSAPEYPDLPLATAAQMSASFSFVSSVARIPHGYHLAPPPSEVKLQNAVHFADGGYYDNDGVASALEFLYSALGHSVSSPPAVAAPKAPSPRSESPSGASAPQPSNYSIILIEIRDGSDPATEDPNRLVDQVSSPSGRATPLNSLGQINAVLQVFYNAGHASITSRNQRNLRVLRDALHLDSAHFVDIPISYADSSQPLDQSQTSRSNFHQQAATSEPDADSSIQPLSWYLTPVQVADLRTAARNARPKIEEVMQQIARIRNVQMH